MEMTFELFGDLYHCKQFFDIAGISTSVSGVEVRCNDEYLGIMLVNLPDSEDTEEVQKFTKELETWVIDNNH